MEEVVVVVRCLGRSPGRLSEHTSVVTGEGVVDAELVTCVGVLVG